MILQLLISRLSSDRSLLGVHVLAVPPNESQINQTDTPTDDDGDFGGLVSWGVLRAECLRAWMQNGEFQSLLTSNIRTRGIILTYDISNTIADQINRGDGCLLRVARNVGGDQ